MPRLPDGHHHFDSGSVRIGTESTTFWLFGASCNYICCLDAFSAFGWPITLVYDFGEMAFLANQALDRLVKGYGKSFSVSTNDSSSDLDDIVKVEQRKSN